MQPPATGPTPSAPGDDLPPPLVPNHRVFQCIGIGAYGKVWLARNAMGEWRAVKAVYRRNFANNPRAYRREYKGIRRYSPVSLRHESLLPILEVGHDQEAGCFYYVMELADHADGARPESAENYAAKTLRRIMDEQGRLPAKECVAIAADLAEALDQLHRQNLVHRDVKPANVVFVYGRPKLADVGLVTDLNATQTEVGTLGYITPELFGKPGGDVYGLGKVLYEMATGSDRLNFPALPSFRGTSEEEHQRLLDLNDVLTKACANTTNGRYRDAAEMRNDLLLLKADQSLAEQRRWRQWRAVTKKYGPRAVAAFVAVSLGIALWLQRAATEIQKQKAWAEGQRAADEARRRELREAQALRMDLHSVGWFKVHSDHLEKAASVRVDHELVDHAAAALIGPELELVSNFTNVAGSSVAFDSSGRVLIGGLSNAPAHLWSPGKNELEPLAMSGDGPVCFSIEGIPLQFVHIGGGRFALRETDTGRIRKQFDLVGDPVTGYDRHPVLAIAADGSKVAAAVKLAEGEGRWAVWEVTSGNQLGICDGLITALAFSPDGKCIATSDEEGDTVLRELSGLRQIMKLPGTRAVIHCLAFAQDPRVDYRNELMRYAWLLAAGGGNGTITVWEISSGRQKCRCVGSNYDVYALAFHSESGLLASGGHDEVRIWDIGTGSAVLRSGSAAEVDLFYIRSLAFSPDTQRLVVATQNRWRPPSVSVWKVQPDRGIQTLRGLAARVSRLWWSPDGKRLAGLAQNWELAVWQLPAGILTHLFEAPIGESADNAALAFHRDANRFAFATGKEVRLYDLAQRRMIHSWHVPMGAADSLRFEDEDRLLYLHSESDPDRGIRRKWALYDLQVSDTKGPTPILRQQEVNLITWETWLPPGGGCFLVTTGTKHDEPPWNIEARSMTNNAVIWHYSVDVQLQEGQAFFDPSGRFLAYDEADGNTTSLLNLPDGTLLRKMPGSAHAISPSGNQFVLSLPNENGFVFQGEDAEGHATRFRLDMEFHPEESPQFSPDSSRLAWGTSEGVVLVADLEEVQRRLRSVGKPRK